MSYVPIRLGGYQLLISPMRLHWYNFETLEFHDTTWGSRLVDTGPMVPTILLYGKIEKTELDKLYDRLYSTDILTLEGDIFKRKFASGKLFVRVARLKLSELRDRDDEYEFEMRLAVLGDGDSFRRASVFEPHYPAHDFGGLYRRAVRITNPLSQELTNYQVLVTVDTATPIASGKMRPDGSDIRFLDSDLVTGLNYWIEPGTINTASTRIWVKVPSIPANATKQIYMYYGKTASLNAPPASGPATFEIFDDFNDGDIAGWTGVDISGSGTWQAHAEAAREGAYGLEGKRTSAGEQALLASPLVEDVAVEAFIRLPDLNPGPKSGSSFANDTSVGTVAWANPANAQASDDVRASASLGGYAVSNYLKATGFGFSIPSTATIQGIKVEVERQGFRIADYSVKIVKGGAIGGTEHAIATEWNPSADEVVAYGGPTDLWGLSWTPADINSPGFGVAISAKNNHVDPKTAYIDHIKITVYFSGAGGDGGLMYAYADANNFYAARLVGAENRVALVKKSGGAESELGSAAMALSNTAWHRLTLRARKSGTSLILAVDVDGVNKISVTDATPLATPSRTGFDFKGEINSRLWADVFLVRKLASAEPSTSLGLEANVNPAIEALALPVGSTNASESVTLARASEEGPVPLVVKPKLSEVLYDANDLDLGKGNIAFKRIGREWQFGNRLIRLQSRVDESLNPGRFDVECWDGLAWQKLGELGFEVSTLSVADESLDAKTPAVYLEVSHDKELGVVSAYYPALDLSLAKILVRFKLFRGKPFIAVECVNASSNLSLTGFSVKLHASGTGWRYLTRSGSTLDAQVGDYGVNSQAGDGDGENVAYLHTASPLAGGALVLGIARAKAAMTHIARDAGLYWEYLANKFAVTMEPGSESPLTWVMAYKYDGVNDNQPARLGMEALAELYVRQTVKRAA